MNDLSATLTILSAMITPAILIMASGSLILTTSQRLGRVIERTRKIADRFEELAKVELLAKQDATFLEEEKHHLFEQLGRATRRSRLLQRAMASLYLALGVFVATSVVIGLVSIIQLKYTWIPVLFGMMGASLLLYASLLLIVESRIALIAIDEEMDFVLHIGQLHVPHDLMKHHKAENGWLKWLKV
jgi:hypothetical protein